MNKIFNSTWSFVRRNQKAIAVGAIAALVISAQQSGIRSMSAFLEEKNLLDEYLTPDL
jgi:hypothetical protein